MALGGLWRHGRLVLFAAVVLGALLSQVSASGGQVAYWRDRAGQLLVEVRYRGELALESVQAWGKNRWPAGWWPFDEARQAQVSGSPPVPVHAKVRNSAAEKERSGQLSSRHVTAALQPRAGVVTSASTGAAVAGAVSLADPQPDRPGEADVLADASVQLPNTWCRWVRGSCSCLAGLTVLSRLAQLTGGFRASVVDPGRQRSSLSGSLFRKVGCRCAGRGSGAASAATPPARVMRPLPPARRTSSRTRKRPQRQPFRLAGKRSTRC